MANLTITVDAATLKRARIRALERGESVNQVLAERLREYVEADEVADRRQAAADALVELSRELAGRGTGQAWSREDLYEDRLG